MLLRSFARPASRYHRILYLVCTLLVCSYIFFEVLDLDGSNFHRPRAPAGRSVIVAEVISVVDLHEFPEFAVAAGDIALWPAVAFANDSQYLRQATVLRFSPLDSARSHGYRVGLPRDSVPD